jgi:leishmanolysin-like peptidase
MHFGCATLQGVELENQGGRGTAMDHWEQRILGVSIIFYHHSKSAVTCPCIIEWGYDWRVHIQSCVLEPHSGSTIWLGVTPIILRHSNKWLFEFMLVFRWYDVDFTRAEELVWGRGQGCDFVTQSCREIFTNQFQQKYEGTFCVCKRSYRLNASLP